MSEEIEFRDEDFQDMMFNFNEAPRNKNLTKYYPRLSEFEEFKCDFKNISKNRLIKYIGFVYDPKSPLVNRIENLPRRKVIAATLAGFVAGEDGRFDKSIVEVMKGVNRKANRMIIRFCRLHGRSYSLIVAGTGAYFDIIEQIQTNTMTNKGRIIIDDGEVKSKLFDKADSMLKRIDMLADDMLVKDRNTELEDDLYLLVDKEEAPVNLSPETFSEDLV